MPTETMISCDALTKPVGHSKALDLVSFAVAKGSILGFLGPNGSGKSTVIRRLCGSSRATVSLQMGVIPFRLRAPAFKPKIA